MMSRVILFWIVFISLASCTSTSDTETDLINKLKPLDRPLKKPVAGEWLFEHHETGQTYEAYIKSSPIKPNDTIRTI